MNWIRRVLHRDRVLRTIDQVLGDQIALGPIGAGPGRAFASVRLRRRLRAHDRRGGRRGAAADLRHRPADQCGLPAWVAAGPAELQRRGRRTAPAWSCTPRSRCGCAWAGDADRGPDRSRSQDGHPARGDAAQSSPGSTPACAASCSR
ncbi:hypothetical protein G5V59_17790 [Nocardioides sp. W3-2-3]|nr:hypothetical protein [Nocardioides convexus]